MPDLPAVQPLGLVVLSAVRHAASYLPVFTSMPSVRLLAIGDETTAPDWAHADGRRLAAQYNVPFTPDADRLLVESGADLVLVCSEPVRHARLAELALLAGKHVIVDKPMATTFEDCNRLVAAVARSDKRFTVMHRLFSPAIERAVSAVAAGHLGLLRTIDIEWLASDGLSGTSVERPEFVADPALSGGGELLNFGVYPISYLRALTGAEIVEVYAERSSLFFAPHRDHGVEDIALLSIRMDHDILATVTVGRVPQAPSPGPLSSTLRLIGSHGHMTVDENAPALNIWGHESQGRRHRPIGGDPGTVAVTHAIAEFLRDIRENRVPRFGVQDGRAAIAAIQAAYRSAETGQPAAVRHL